MSLTTIRKFSHAGRHYRHAICLDTDAVFLQRYTDDEEAANCREDLWHTLLKYDSSCGAWDAEGKSLGNFTTEGTSEQWVFYENPLRTRIEFPRMRGAEILLDAEVYYSKRWLEQQRIEGYNAAVAAANLLEPQIRALVDQQDALLKEPAFFLESKIAECDDRDALQEIARHLDTWPQGLYRSAVRSAWAKKAFKLGYTDLDKEGPAASGPATLPPAAAVTSNDRSQ